MQEFASFGVFHIKTRYSTHGIMEHNLKSSALRIFAFCAFFIAASCLNDDPAEDKSENMKLHVSAMTCVSGTLFGSDPIEGMLVRSGDSPDYHFLAFGAVGGFTPRRGYAYELWVERITLAEPPADGSLYRYRLIREISARQSEGIRTDMRLHVSPEPGTYLWPDMPQRDPGMGLKIREETEEEWLVVPINKVDGFLYEQGYAYELDVEKIVLSAPAENSRWQTVHYVLRSIVTKEKVRRSP